MKVCAEPRSCGARRSETCGCGGWGDVIETSGRETLFDSQIPNGILRVADIAPKLFDQRSGSPTVFGAIQSVQAEIQPVFLQRSPAEPVLPLDHGKQWEPGVPENRDAPASKPANGGHRRLEPACPHRLVSLGAGLRDHDGQTIA